MAPRHLPTQDVHDSDDEPEEQPAERLEGYGENQYDDMLDKSVQCL